MASQAPHGAAGGGCLAFVDRAAVRSPDGRMFLLVAAVSTGALASYVRTILAGNSAYDRYAAGDRAALTAEEQVGLGVFRGQGNCTACHTGPTFTDEAFHTME